MGAKWVTVDFKESGEGQGGYAKESSDAFKKVQQAGTGQIALATRGLSPHCPPSGNFQEGPLRM